MHQIIFVTSSSNLHKCYVCGELAQLPFQEGSYNLTTIKNIPKSCDKFEESAEKNDFKTFEFTCPKGYDGCITKICNHQFNRFVL